MKARPASHPLDPIRDRLRRRRLSLRLTFRTIAGRAGLRSAAYVFHIETGHRVPTEAVAVRLARAVGENERVFAAWARALERTDLRTVLGATRELLEDPELSAYADGAWAPIEPDAPGSRPLALSRATGESIARLRVPVIASGADPGDALRPACPVIRTLSLDARGLVDAETWIRPFAYVLDSEIVRRVPALAVGHIAIFTRHLGPVAPMAVRAVRLGGRIELARVMWNGRELLVMPAAGESDFAVLPAGNAAALRACIAGTIAQVLDPAHAPP